MTVQKMEQPAQEKVEPPPEAAIEYARSKKDKIAEWLDKRLRPGLIARNLSLDRAALDVVINEIMEERKAGKTEHTGHGESGKGDTVQAREMKADTGRMVSQPGASPGNKTPADGGAPFATVVGIPPVPSPVPPGGQDRNRVKDEKTPNIAGTEGYSPAYGYDPATGEHRETVSVYGAPTISPGEAKGSFLEGPFEVHDPYYLLYIILTEFGIKDAAAKGFCRQFRHFDPHRYDKLEEMLTVGGVNPQARKSIINTFRVEMEPAGVEGTDDSEKLDTDNPDERLRRIKERLGMAVKGESPELDEITQLEKEQRKIEVERLKIALEKEKAELERVRKEAGGGTVVSADDDTVEVPLKIGGMPVFRRIRWSELPKYERWLARDDDGESKVTQLENEIRQLREMMQKKEEEARLEQIRRENEELKQRISAPQTDPRLEAMQEEMKTLRNELLNREREGYRSTIDDLSRRISELDRDMRYYSSWDYQVKAKEDAEKRARALGYIPKDEALRINEEQIRLQDQANAVKRKDEATGKALETMAKKVDETGALRKAAEKIANSDKFTDRVLDIIDKVGENPAQVGAQPVGPSIEELEARAAELERQQKKEGVSVGGIEAR